MLHDVKERDEIEELSVRVVVKPRAHRNCVVRVKYVGCRGVVYYYTVLNIPTQLI